MNLDELRGNHTNGVTEIDATAGKVAPLEYVPPQRPIDPQFAPSERIRGSGKRTPTIDNLPEPKKPKPMQEVKTRGQVLTGMDKFDVNTLPKKPPEKNPLEDSLYNDLEAAVDAEIESVEERMYAVADMQYKEHLAKKQAELESNNSTAQQDIETMFEDDFEPETEVAFDQPNEADESSDSDEEFFNNEDVDTFFDDLDDLVDEEFDMEEEEDPSETFNEDKNEEYESDFPADLDFDSDEEVMEEKDDSPIVIESEESDSDNFEEFDQEEENRGIKVEDTQGIDEDEFFNKADSIADDLKRETREQDDIDEDKMLDELKTAVKGSISTIKKKIDLSKFSVAKTPVAASKAISFSIKDVSKADWVLPNAEICITATGLSGSEIFSLDPSNSNRNKINTFKEIYSIIYRHIENPDKGSFERWMKTTRYSDISHVYFALYRATFYGSNFIHYECPDCHHVFIKDFDFDELVKYKDDETKKKMHNIMNGHVTAAKKYPVTRYQVSDNYVFDIREPSVWNTVIEVASLSDAFLEKYEDLINTIIAIDKIYVIDFDRNQLIPIDPNKVDGNIVQTVANKISTYSDIIKNIPPDAFFDLRTKIANAFQSTEDIKYVVPSCSCPRCKRKIEEQEREGSDLLFTRHQLGALGVI